MGSVLSCCDAKLPPSPPQASFLWQDHKQFTLVRDELVALGQLTLLYCPDKTLAMSIAGFPTLLKSSQWTQTISPTSDENRYPRLSMWPNAALAERATETLCSRLGVNNIARQERPEDWFEYANARFDACGNLRRAAAGKIDYFWQPVMGRFGNNFQQIVHAIALAEIEGVAQIYHGLGWLPPRLRISDGIVLLRGKPSFLSFRAGLRVGAFSRWRLPGLQGLGAEDVARISQTLLAPAMQWIEEPAEKNAITIYFRAGDVTKFQPNRNPTFVQPPAAFYTRAIETIAAKTGRDQLKLVYMDRSNPAIKQVEDWALHTGFAVIANVNADFDEDVRSMLAAEHLIVGHSSFSDALAQLSRNLKSFSFFRAAHNISALHFRAVKLFHGVDVDQKYIPHGTWSNSNAQRELIVNYPQQSIEITDLSDNDADAVSAYDLGNLKNGLPPLS